MKRPEGALARACAAMIELCPSCEMFWTTVPDARLRAMRITATVSNGGGRGQREPPRRAMAVVDVCCKCHSFKPPWQSPRGGTGRLEEAAAVRRGARRRHVP